MVYEEFEREFLGTHKYTTPEHQRLRPLDYLFGWSNALYYLRSFGITCRGASMVRRGAWNQASWARLSFRIWQAVEGAGGRILLEGGEHLASLDSPAVYVANHMSMLETLLLPASILPYQLVTLVVKENLMRYPIFGVLMRGGVRPIVVQRRNPREDYKTVMEEGELVLDGGRSVIVFPQSTRSPELDPESFNSLGVKLARKAGVPVVPLALKTDFQGLGRLIKDMGRVDRSKPVHVKFGKPMMVEGNGKEEHASVLRFIEDNLIAWGGAVKGRISPPAAENGKIQD